MNEIRGRDISVKLTLALSREWRKWKKETRSSWNHRFCLSQRNGHQLYSDSKQTEKKWNITVTCSFTKPWDMRQRPVLREHGVRKQRDNMYTSCGEQKQRPQRRHR